MESHLRPPGDLGRPEDQNVSRQGSIPSAAIAGVIMGGCTSALLLACAGATLSGIFIGAVGGSFIGWSVFDGRLGGATVGFALAFSAAALAVVACIDPSPYRDDDFSCVGLALRLATPVGLIGALLGHVLDRLVRLR